MPQRLPNRRSRRVAVLTETDQRIEGQGQVGAFINPTALNYGLIMFYNNDDAGRDLDVSALYVWLGGAASGVVGYLTGVAGATKFADATHSVLNYSPPPGQAFTLQQPTDPSTFMWHFGTSSGGQITTPSGIIHRIPAGYSLLVRPESVNTSIRASILFNVRSRR